MAASPPTLLAGVSMYCKQCGYDLHGNVSLVCPECGQAFDPADSRTFRKRPPRSRLWRWTIRGLLTLAGLIVLLGATWGWLYWGWCEEQQLIAKSGLKLSINNVSYFGSSPTIFIDPLGGEWGRRIQPRLGPLGFVLDRVQRAVIPDGATNEQLQDLVNHLKLFKNLRDLNFMQTQITDDGLACIHQLPTLESLDLTTVDQVTDAGLDCLTRLPNLRRLCLNGKHVTDRSLAFLKELRKLELLCLDGSAITDAVLARLVVFKGLQSLVLINTEVTPEGVNKLQKVLPETKIIPMTVTL